MMPVQAGSGPLEPHPLTLQEVLASLVATYGIRRGGVEAETVNGWG